jgi:hypothetical protein
MPDQFERLIALVGCINDPIFMADPKNMGVTCMRESRLEGGGVNRVNLKFTTLSTTKSRG